MILVCNQNKDYPYRRWVLYIFSLLITGTSAGLVYGWPVLRRILIQNDETNLSEKTLGAIFTAAAWTTQGGRFFFGIARDRFGTKRTTCFALFAVTVGLCGVAFCDSSDAIGLAISLCLVGLGSGIQLTVQPVAGLFPNRRGTILSSTSGAFHVSGLMFLILRFISTERNKIFIGFAILVCIFLVIAAFILPYGSSFVLEESIPDQLTSSNNVENKNERTESESSMSSTLSTSVISSKPKNSNTSALAQIKSLEYVLLIVWFSACVICLQYYVGSIGFQLERKGDITGFYTNLQQVAYSSVSILSPLVGLFADKCGLGMAQGLGTVLSAFAFFILAFNSISLNIHVWGLICYGAGRMFVFSMFFSNIGKRFGFENYGTLTGLGLVISAIFSIIQYPLIAFADDGKDSTVNLVCGFVFILILPYCLWLHKIEHLPSRKKDSNDSEKQELPK